MKCIRVYTLPILLAVIILPSAAAAQSKEQREKIDRMATQVEDLKTELVLLQRQTQSMQDTFNKTMGELNTLIVQMSDNISTIRRATESVSTRGGDVVSQVSSMGERITATNDRMERLSEQFAQLKKLIENLPKAPVLGNYDPGNPDQLFAAATGDYFRGNFDLALSEFRQYVETYPSSEMADNAQYFIGEILVAQNKKSDAVAAFEKVKTVNPSGDKTAPALYKRGMILLELGQREEGVIQLLAIFKDYSKTKEGELAFLKLQEIAPESLPQNPSTPPRRFALVFRRPLLDRFAIACTGAEPRVVYSRLFPNWIPDRTKP
jgi:tol-pal system protein YbgF